MKPHGVVILVVLLLVVPAAFRQVVTFVSRRGRRLILPAGLRRRMGTLALRRQLFSLAVIIFSFVGGLWTFEVVGPSEIAWPLSVLLGLVLFLPFVLLIRFLYRIFGKPELLETLGLAVTRAIYPRRANEKCRFAVAVVILNPIVEEWMYRGVCVFWASQYLGIGPALGLGLFLCLAGHSYQGASSLPFHIAFFALASALVLSPLGLPGAIGLHFAGDLVPVWTLRSKMLALRRERARRARSRQQ